MATSGSPFSFDLAVLREMYRTGAATVAGIDPRLNVSQIAQRMGCSRAKVAARLAFWERTGFLARYDVWPNPTHFGLAGASVELRVTDRRSKDRVLERLALLDGAVGAIEFLGDWITYQYLFPDPAAGDRRRRLLAHVDGIAEVGQQLPWARIPPRRPLSPLDLRIVRAFRQSPRASLEEIGRTVGVSTRTVTNRYGALVADWSVWFVPIFDFTRLPGGVASLVVDLDAPARREEIRRRFRRSYPDSLEFGGAGPGSEEIVERAVFFVYLPSAAAHEEVERAVVGWEGVRAVETTMLVRIHSFGETFDELLRTWGAPAPPAAPPRAPRRGPP